MKLYAIQSVQENGMFKVDIFKDEYLFDFCKARAREGERFFLINGDDDAMVMSFYLTRGMHRNMTQENVDFIFGHMKKEGLSVMELVGV